MTPASSHRRMKRSCSLRRSTWRARPEVCDAPNAPPTTSVLCFVLTLRISPPRCATVSDTSPYFKRALALLSAVENAAQTEPREAEVAAADALLDAKLDALFAGDFPIASLELDDA